jgi:hypothetical protein
MNKRFQLIYINVQRFRGGLVFKAHRLVYHSILGEHVGDRVDMVPGNVQVRQRHLRKMGSSQSKNNFTNAPYK